MKRLIAALVLLFPPGAAFASPDGQEFPMIERGRQLTVIGDCQACHTAPGSQPFAGGRAVETPFGVLHSSNITPDPETGIGAWTDQQFVDSLQKGRNHRGRHLYPAMPYTYTARVTRPDALAIRAYLATLPPVRHEVAEDTLPFPFNIRALMGVWDWLYFTKGAFKPDPARSPEWNRGAYLVTGLEHCGMCHTPKTVFGGDQTSNTFKGYALQGWFAPDLTNDPRRGLGNWSVDDIVAYLQTGHNRFAAASGPMAEEVAMSSQHTSPDDLHAIAVYLKSQPNQTNETVQPLATTRPDMKAGAAIYADLCSSCHKPDGDGVPGLFPRLAGGSAVQSTDPSSVIRVILRGVRSVGTKAAPTAPGMPSFSWTLTDAQVAAVATYVRNGWGNAASPVTPDQVSKARAELSNRPTD